MIATTYTCDRCGNKQDTPEQMWNMEVHVFHENGAGRADYSTRKVKLLWCRSCVEDVRLLPSLRGDDKLPIKPSFEDLIRELAREEIEVAKL